MSITPLRRVTVCGPVRDKRAILEALQEVGCLHLVPLGARDESAGPPPPPWKAAYEALRFLSNTPRRRRQVVRDPAFDVDRLVADALALEEALRVTADRRDFLANRIAELEPWGDLRFPPEEALSGLRLWFYVLPLRKLGALDAVETPWQVVHRDNRFAYVVLIAEEEPPEDLLPVPRAHVGSLPRSALEARLEDTEVALEDLAAQREALSRYVLLLGRNLAEAEDRVALELAGDLTLDDAVLSIVQGWAPEDALDALADLADARGLALAVEAPTADDAPPTLLRQPEGMEAATDLALFYQVPSYRSWDPSLLVFGSFAVFFAMIVADAGYGLVLLAGLLAGWSRLGGTVRGRAYRRLGLALCGCTVVYGALAGGWFGAAPPEGSLLDRVKILDLDDFGTMMTLSVLIGVGHLVFANAMMAHARRHEPRAFASLGWIAALLGGLGLWLAPAAGPWDPLAATVMAGGLLAVVPFSSDRPVTDAKSLALRAVDGLRALTGAMGAFGDVLSYLRLFALGLARASLAITFNALATDAREALPGLGVLLALVTLIVGHGLNLCLSVISGVVHGLRLNFIEFYKWGLGEVGEAFRPFARKRIEP